tara:strand:+ start:1671 stop:2540 length:870 start_codon:yes stop_codon:yes gene_type:complete
MIKMYPISPTEEGTKKRKRNPTTSAIVTTTTRTDYPPFIQDCITYIRNLGHNIRKVKIDKAQEDKEIFYICLGKNEMDRTCPFAKRVHSNNNVDYIANPETHELVLHCQKKCRTSNGKKRIVYTQQDDGQFRELRFKRRKLYENERDEDREEEEEDEEDEECVEDKDSEEDEEDEEDENDISHVPEKYAIFLKLYDSNLKFTDWSIAQILKHYLNNRAVCVSEKQHHWYYFEESAHKWQEDDDASKILAFMSQVVTKHAYDLWHVLIRNTKTLPTKRNEKQLNNSNPHS